MPDPVAVPVPPPTTEDVEALREDAERPPARLARAVLYLLDQVDRGHSKADVALRLLRNPYAPGTVNHGEWDTARDSALFGDAPPSNSAPAPDLGSGTPNPSLSGEPCIPPPPTEEDREAVRRATEGEAMTVGVLGRTLWYLLDQVDEEEPEHSVTRCRWVDPFLPERGSYWECQHGRFVYPTEGQAIEARTAHLAGAVPVPGGCVEGHRWGWTADNGLIKQRACEDCGHVEVLEDRTTAPPPVPGGDEAEVDALVASGTLGFVGDRISDPVHGGILKAQGTTESDLDPCMSWGHAAALANRVGCDDATARAAVEAGWTWLPEDFCVAPRDHVAAVGEPEEGAAVGVSDPYFAAINKALHDRWDDIISDRDGPPSLAACVAADAIAPLRARLESGLGEARTERDRLRKGLERIAGWGATQITDDHDHEWGKGWRFASDEYTRMAQDVLTPAAEKTTDG